MQKQAMQCEALARRERYKAPELEISLFHLSDVVITSPNDGEWDTDNITEGTK